MPSGGKSMECGIFEDEWGSPQNDEWRRSLWELEGLM